MDLQRPNTLLFLDEIQEVPWLLELLRFFYEETPDLAVIASGSLLEVKLELKKISIPVGRVQNYYLYPLNFFEFLSANGEDRLLEELHTVTWKNPLPLPLHEQAIEQFNLYLLLGGMPEVVNAFCSTGDAEQIREIKKDLMLTYEEDVLKYSSAAEVEYISHVIEQAPKYAGARFNYSKFAGSKYNSRHMQLAFRVLEQAMILHQLEATDQLNLPIVGQKKRQKKLLYLDVGLTSHSFGLRLRIPKQDTLNSMFKGNIVEQAVGQQLIGYNFREKQKLHYWAKQSNVGAAEVDFIFQHKERLIAIEVKSGSSGKLKSLISLGESKANAILCRLYSGELVVEKRGKLSIHSIPFYLLPRVKDFL